ncbi:sugar and other transporter-domain-containing protein [Aspergillus flavus]|uniref:Sugar and other transporter-domain-containing protein n=1 Tax=Aspergillus flavus (strain ATCC 200026 / FGSC A1120 / IAM 13836 / NRRL 3357 / JCM 12722 / SRRC 167) TaxID=332952 RepID=A0A7U2MMM2_ASPFN|nr:sugar and other transporter-domain-containing protein [Aspergillus flavus]
MGTRHENDTLDPNAPLLILDGHTTHDPQNNEEDRHIDSESNYSGTQFIWALTFSAGLSGLLFGYDTGVISSTLVSIGTDLSDRDLTTLDKSLITSCTSLFALVASPLAGVLADKFGRRKVIFVADALFALGAFVQAISNEVWGMIAGRSIVGLAVGGASLVTPLYISELAPSNMRGRLVTILSLFITGGQVVAYIVGWLFSLIDGGWRWIVGLGILPALFQLVILTALPETPRWLAQAGFETNAIAVLGKVYQGHPDSDCITKRILREIQQEVAEERLGHPGGSSGAGQQWIHYVLQRTTELFYVGGNRRALIIAMMLQGSQQLSGFNCLMYFSGIIFSSLSFSSPTLTSLSVATTNFLFTLLAFTYIDRIGRRRILLYSIPIMTISLIVCALTFSLVSSDLSSFPLTRAGSSDTVPDDSMLPITILLCLTVYTASYAFGLGNVPWQQSELFPLSVRSLGSAFATATNWASNFVVGLTFLPMMELLSPGWTFGTYAVVCAVSWFAVWAIYPEMSGLGLEEVKELLADGWGVKESVTRVYGSKRENLLPGESSVWRYRFMKLYDTPPGRSSSELKIEYQTRSIVLSQKISFRFGQKEEQLLWLTVMQGILLEALTVTEIDGVVYSKTFERIREALQLSAPDILNRPLSGYGNTKPDRPSDLFCGLQLCLTGLALDPKMSVRCLRTDYDIADVYSYQTEITRPFIDIKKLELPTILHIRNFWVRHLLSPNEATYCTSYAKLPVDQRPRTMLTLVNSQFFQIRSDLNTLNWPPEFNRIIPMVGPESHRLYFRGLQKLGDDLYPVRGFTEPIRGSQGGFPGWQRICFAIYAADREQLPLLLEIGESEPSDVEAACLLSELWPPGELETDFLWIQGYEGVILPGGKIMLGQWVDMIDTTERGPFIFWNL